jgi:DNA-binding CsgD family transcriptional regulator
MLMSQIESPSSAPCSGAWFVRAMNCPTFIVRLPRDGRRRYIGRGHDCDIRIPDASISRQHARIEFHGHSMEIIDLGSRNGVIVDGKRVPHSAITSGQLVLVGDWELLFTFESDIEEPTTRQVAPFDIRESLLVSLTPAQRRVAMLMLEENTEKQIAESLSLSYFTVHNHVKVIYRKCDVQSRRQFLEMFRMETQV